MEVDPTTLGQYIGYNDWEDEEIYEGDILRRENGGGSGNGYDSLHRVEWCPEWGQWVMYGINQPHPSGEPSKDGLTDRYFRRDMLIAKCYPLRREGNKHDNPELLVNKPTPEREEGAEQ